MLNGLENVDKQLLGSTTIGRTVYQVYRMQVGPNAVKAGIRGHFALVGPRGAAYFVTDHGPRYQLNSVACGGGRSWSPAPRALRGLDRVHLAQWLDSDDRSAS